MIDAVLESSIVYDQEIQQLMIDILSSQDPEDHSVVLYVALQGARWCKRLCHSTDWRIRKWGTDFKNLFEERAVACTELAEFDCKILFRDYLYGSMIDLAVDAEAHVFIESNLVQEAIQSAWTGGISFDTDPWFYGIRSVFTSIKKLDTVPPCVQFFSSCLNLVLIVACLLVSLSLRHYTQTSGYWWEIAIIYLCIAGLLPEYRRSYVRTVVHLSYYNLSFYNTLLTLAALASGLRSYFRFTASTALIALGNTSPGSRCVISPSNCHHLASGHDFRACSIFMAAVTFLLCLHLVRFFFVSKSMGPVVIATERMAKDLLRMLIILALPVLAFACIFSALDEQDPPHSILEMCFLLVLAVLQQDGFNIDQAESVSPVAGTILFLIFLVVMNVLALNILIAVLNRSFQVMCSVSWCRFPCCGTTNLVRSFVPFNFC